jgi:hypothetical protein
MPAGGRTFATLASKRMALLGRSLGHDAIARPHGRACEGLQCPLSELALRQVESQKSGICAKESAVWPNLQQSRNSQPTENSWAEG